MYFDGCSLQLLLNMLFLIENDENGVDLEICNHIVYSDSGMCCSSGNNATVLFGQ